ncbi:MAG: HipA N-terminal domain-containing protein [Rhizobiaceae bacterium]|nr:HipA N-terminal domain-containing protein [Rhizobiaceae bacterium]
MSLPLREDAYRGEPVVEVFDNLLPNSDALRKCVAQRVGAAGFDAYRLLAAIGHDRVGALQFIADGAAADEHGHRINQLITGGYHVVRRLRCGPKARMP